jgi:hypothetical protein
MVVLEGEVGDRRTGRVPEPPPSPQVPFRGPWEHLKGRGIFAVCHAAASAALSIVMHGVARERRQAIRAYHASRPCDGYNHFKHVVADRQRRLARICNSASMKTWKGGTFLALYAFHLRKENSVRFRMVRGSSLSDN